MTTRGVQDPIAIHFVIDGQHGILEARDIAVSMHFPPIPEDLGSFRHWSQYSEPDIVSALSGGVVIIVESSLPVRVWTQFLDRSRMDQGLLRLLAPTPPAALAPTVQTLPEQDPHTTEPSSSVPAPVTCTTDTPAPPITSTPAYAEFSVGPSITISAIEFRALMSSFHSLSASQATLVREMQAIRRQMDTIQTHQAQHTAILD
ncbi:hypothetical protein CK203_106537 [Vitis vinifera]|uniref:Uncharacterized protein n=1 Tax=Vitis vinifera TaxID=29760 RepID=A0A438D5U1_VITVI|nr:hypothetical protein CK203_106537 [Vitis vinifera]